MRHFLTGWARLCITGDRPERLLSAAAAASIPFWDCGAPAALSMQLCVRDRDAARLQALGKRQGLDCAVLESGGWPRLWRSLRRRGVLLAALGLCALALVVGRGFIWHVEIADTAGLSESLLRESLRECGVDVGVFWPSISQDLTRNALLRRLPQLRWATVNLRGGTAEVIVRPAREVPAIENERECADIVARCGGYITQVHALRGAAAVTVGQTVTEGQLLISGEAIGRYTSHGAVHAIGTVQAQTWYELSAAAPMETEKALRGDCVCTRWALIFGKRRINFYKGCSICPSGCAKMTEETFFAAEGVFFLPLSLVRERVYETELVFASEENAVERMQQELVQRLRAALPDDGELESYFFTQSESDGWRLVTLHAECSESIGVTVPMTAEQIAAKSPQTKEVEP